MREAIYYRTLEDKKVQCLLCPHLCIIEDRGEGLCRSRTNIAGVLQATNYGKTISFSVDPIEKKPLYHYRPGSSILSLGANSCNFACFFCQNYGISQNIAPTETISPEALYAYLEQNDIKQIAFTYTEPFTWYEYVYDFGQLCQDHNIDIILVSNGFVNQEPLQELIPYVSAMNIDLKAFDDNFYQKYCGGRLQPVLDTIKSAYHAGVHLELTNLLIPGLNTDMRMIEPLVQFVADLDVRIPLHFSKYHPAFKSKIPPTSDCTIKEACEKASQKLINVYAGNALIKGFSDTSCQNCGTILISNRYSKAKSRVLSDGSCPECTTGIYGKFSF